MEKVILKYISMMRRQGLFNFLSIDNNIVELEKDKQGPLKISSCSNIKKVNQVKASLEALAVAESPEDPVTKFREYVSWIESGGSISSGDVIFCHLNTISNGKIVAKSSFSLEELSEELGCDVTQLNSKEKERLRVAFELFGSDLIDAYNWAIDWIQGYDRDSLVRDLKDSIRRVFSYFRPKKTPGTVWSLEYHDRNKLHEISSWTTNKEFANKKAITEERDSIQYISSLAPGRIVLQLNSLPGLDQCLIIDIQEIIIEPGVYDIKEEPTSKQSALYAVCLNSTKPSHYLEDYNSARDMAKQYSTWSLIKKYEDGYKSLSFCSPYMKILDMVQGDCGLGAYRRGAYHIKDIPGNLEDKILKWIDIHYPKPPDTITAAVRHSTVVCGSKSVSNYSNFKWVYPVVEELMKKYFPKCNENPIIRLGGNSNLEGDTLAKTIYNKKDGTSSIILHKSILEDPSLTRQVLAHELIHHYLFSIGITDVHGQEFKELADRINEVEGPGYVTDIADKTNFQLID